MLWPSCGETPRHSHSPRAAWGASPSLHPTHKRCCWCRDPLLGMGGASRGMGEVPEARPRLAMSQRSRDDPRREGARGRQHPREGTHSYRRRGRGGDKLNKYVVGGINSKEGRGCHNTWAGGQEGRRPGLLLLPGVGGLLLSPLPPGRAQRKALMKGAQVCRGQTGPVTPAPPPRPPPPPPPPRIQGSAGRTAQD